MTEINFWNELEVELKHIQSQLMLPEAECTLSLLKQKKRFITTAAFETDTIGLKKSLDKVASYKPVIKDLDRPIQELFTAELNGISSILIAIFDHLKRGSKKSGYPIERFLILVECINKGMLCLIFEPYFSNYSFSLEMFSTRTLDSFFAFSQG